MLDRDIDQIEITVDRSIKEDVCNRRNAALRRSLRQEKPASVRRCAEKAEAKRRVPAERLAADLRRKREPNRILAAEITRYVERMGGEVTGASLSDIHAEFAQVLLGNVSKPALVRIGAAMQFAIGKGWLEEQEADCTYRSRPLAA